MTLLWLLTIPLAGGMVAWLAGRIQPLWSRWVALAALVANLLLSIGAMALHPPTAAPIGDGPWVLVFDRSWIATFGIRFHLAADGLSLVMVLLVNVLGIVAVASAWEEIARRRGLFYLNLLGVMAGMIGVFTAQDLFLFYSFWEVMLVPMFLLIVIWGHGNRIYAGIKFFLFTQIGGLLMLTAIVGLFFVHLNATGEATFDYTRLLGTAMSPQTAMWLMLGFLAAFAVKLPVVPLHTWLPDAHTQAPTPGSVVLAGLLLKTGAYGMIRFVVPLFPEAARSFAPWGMLLAVIAILYGAVMAFDQSDVKRMVAYTSVSHMGFVFLAIFVWNPLALQGAVVQMICHGVSTGALFVLAGILQDRLKTRELSRMGGLWTDAPRMGGLFAVFALAALALPGMGNFVGEFMILLGAYPVSRPLTILAALGLIASAVYALRLVQMVLHGPVDENRPRIRDLSPRETTTLGAMMVIIVWIGLYPQPVFKALRPTVAALTQKASVAAGPVDVPLPSSKRISLSTAGQGGNHEAR